METEPAPEFVETSYYEFELYEPESSSKNLATGKFATSPANHYKQIALEPNLRVTDGSFGSGIWMMFVPQWIVVDLGEPTVINRIRTISNISGPSQVFSYFASDDNKTWKKLFDHQHGVQTQAFTSDVFNRVTARYVKGEFRDKPFQGNSADVKEIFIYGPGSSTVDIPSLPMNHPPAPPADGGAGETSADAGPARVPSPDAGAFTPAPFAPATKEPPAMGGVQMVPAPAAPELPAQNGAARPDVAAPSDDKAASKEISSGCSLSGPTRTTGPSPLLLFGIGLLAALGTRSRQRRSPVRLPGIGIVLACLGACGSEAPKNAADPGSESDGLSKGSGGTRAQVPQTNPSLGAGGILGRGGSGTPAAVPTASGGSSGSGGAIGSGGAGSTGEGGRVVADAAPAVPLPAPKADAAASTARDSGATDRPPPVVVAPDSVCKNNAPCTKDCQQCIGTQGFIPCRCFGATATKPGHAYCNAEFLIRAACTPPTAPRDAAAK